MALGIFGLGALRQIHGIPASAVQAFVLSLPVVWGFISASFVGLWRAGRLGPAVADAMDRFAVGTWVAGTAVMAQLLLVAVPAWRPVAIAFGLFAFALWLGYLSLVLGGAYAIITDRGRLCATGGILLATVSTQSLALLACQLWPDVGLVRTLATGLIVLGLLFYAIGMVLVVQRYRRQTHWTLVNDWDNANCILHGAMSISGLAIVQTGLLPEAVGVAAWLAAFGVFVVVETLELARMTHRVGRFGLRLGVFTYNVSQWSRNFTFGMFYSFTLALAHPGQAPSAPSVLSPLLAWLLAWGKWVVLFLLLVETVLWCGARVTWVAQPGHGQEFRG